MENLVLDSIQLLSITEKKGKTVSFHPKVTVIMGGNDTGKSSLIKSIYQTFGAKPEVVHPMWEKAQVISVVKFRIGHERYEILNREDFFAIYDSNRKLIDSFMKITSELGPYLSELLNFKLVLNDRNNKPITPPPAFYFLPFYVDQDSSWNKNWSAFRNLNQLKDWKKNLVDYHAGVKPNEYYLVRSDLQVLTSEIAELGKEEKVLRNVYAKVSSDFDKTHFDIDIDKFKEEINELLSLCSNLQKFEEKLKRELVDLHNKMMHIEQQQIVVQESLTNIKLDYEFAINSGEEIECPTCGTIHSNSFAERLSIANDEDRLYEMGLQLQQEHSEIEKKIEQKNKTYWHNSGELQKIQELLEIKREGVKLSDLINNEGKKELKSTLLDDIGEMVQIISGKELKVEKLKNVLKRYENRTRKTEILNKYKKYIQRFLMELKVKNMPESYFKNMNAKINETGSDLPRALLAYYYSFLHVMREYSSSIFCPIIIDSPNQQDQDEDNLTRMIDFVLRNKPADAQLILGLVDPGEIKFEGKTIELNNQYSLLLHEEYDDVLNEVTPLLEQVNLIS